jgi:hypothetical protein
VRRRARQPGIRICPAPADPVTVSDSKRFAGRRYSPVSVRHMSVTRALAERMAVSYMTCAMDSNVWSTLTGLELLEVQGGITERNT